MREVEIGAIALDRLAGLLASDRAERLAAHAVTARRVLDGRTVWNVNATATGGGVAEMLQSLLAYKSTSSSSCCRADGGGRDLRPRSTETPTPEPAAAVPSASRTHLFSGDPMTFSFRTAAAAAALAVAGTGLVVTAPAGAHTTGIHDNCTNFNKRYPHGVGTKAARDKTSGKRVTTFKRSNKIYWAAERHNPDLDRDNDRIACEKA